MKKKILLALVTLVLLLSIVLSGCGGGGVPQADYDKLSAQITDVQSKLTKAQTDLTTLQATKTTEDSDLQTAQTTVTDLEKQVADLDKQVADLKAQYELIGATKAETVEKVVKYYSKTHVYELDVYDCNNMAADIWNMLKVLGINAVLVVGNVDMPISDIFLNNHAWLLAEINPGEYLALETTSGGVVQRSKNTLYYAGWYFPTPKEFNEYLVMIETHNMLAAEDAIVIEEYNQSANQVEADKLEAVHNKLRELIDREKQALQAIPTVTSLLNK